MYNTTCSMMIQMLAGGNIKPTDLVPELGGATVSEFFAKIIFITKKHLEIGLCHH